MGSKRLLHKLSACFLQLHASSFYCYSTFKQRTFRFMHHSIIGTHHGACDQRGAKVTQEAAPSGRRSRVCSSSCPSSAVHAAQGRRLALRGAQAVDPEQLLGCVQGLPWRRPQQDFGDVWELYSQVDGNSDFEYLSRAIFKFRRLQGIPKSCFF